MGLRAAGRNRAEQLICAQRPFKQSNISGVEGAVSSTGQLPEPHRTAYNDAARANMLAYTVLSYATPILWVLRDGTVISPNVRYSVTTVQHQYIARDCFRGRISE